MSTNAYEQDLIESCQDLVRSLAWKLVRRLPPKYDVEDLIGYGQIGLVEAARVFDAQRGENFGTFAYYRIRGAMYEGLARLSGMSRRHYRQLRFEQVSDDLIHAAGEADSSVPNNDDARWLRQTVGRLAVAWLSLNAPHDDNSSLTECMVDAESKTPAHEMIQKETLDLLRGLLNELPDDAQLLIRSVYFEGRTLREAGSLIGVQKSWASRLHARTLDELAKSLKVLVGNDLE